MEEIKDFLSAPFNYPIGVKLYLKYGNNPQLKRLFTEEDETPFKVKKLIKSLGELVENYDNPATVKAIIQKQADATPVDAHRGWPAKKDKVIQTLYDQWKPLYNELINSQSRIYDVCLLAEKDDAYKISAAQLAHKILDLDDECDLIYARRDYYLIHGQLPAIEKKEEEVSADPRRWALNIENQKKKFRRYRLKISKDPKNKNAPHWAQLMQDAEKEIIKFEKLLNG